MSGVLIAETCNLALLPLIDFNATLDTIVLGRGDAALSFSEVFI
jgi:hypothetical protein